MRKKSETELAPYIKINRPKELALRLGVPLEVLEDVASHMQAHAYPFQKRVGGKIRTLYTRSAALENIHKRLESNILDKFEYPVEFKGGVKRRSLADNARVHTRHKNIAKLDIQNFFPSIDPDRIYTAFRNVGCAPKVARLLATLTSVDSQLPQGFGTSPKVAALVLIPANTRLRAFLKTHGVSFSFWIDDIAVSGGYPVKKLLPTVRSIIVSEGFKTHKDVGPTYQNERQTVTNIVVNEKPAPSREVRAEMRRTLYLCKKYGIRSYKRKYVGDEKTLRSFVQRTSGQIGHLIAIDRKKYLPLLHEWEKNVCENGLGHYIKKPNLTS